MRCSRADLLAVAGAKATFVTMADICRLSGAWAVATSPPMAEGSAHLLFECGHNDFALQPNAQATKLMCCDQFIRAKTGGGGDAVRVGLACR